MDSDLPPHPLAAKHAAIPTCWYLGGEFSRITVPYTLCHQRRNLQRCNTATQHKMMCLYVCEKNGHPSTILNSILKSFIFHWNWGPSGTSGPSGPRRPSPSTSSPAKISAPAPSASGWNMLKLHHRWSPRHNSWEQTALLIATLPPASKAPSNAHNALIISYIFLYALIKMALRYVFSLFFRFVSWGVMSLCFLSTLYSQWPHEPYSACRCLCQAISAQCPMMSDVKSEPDKNRQGSVWVQGISSVRICTSSDSAVCTLMHSATLAEMRNNPKFRRIWSSLKPTHFSQPLPSTLFLPLSSNYRISVSHRMFHGQKMY